MIPKIVHQTWKNNNIPDKWKNFHQTWKDKFNEDEYQHILWTDEDNRKLIKDHYSWFLNTYDNYPRNIQRADAIRYFILYHYGGIYADLDCEVRENFYDDLDPDNISLAESPFHDNCFMNNLMTSNKKNEKWKIVFDQLDKNKNIMMTGGSTGPGLLNDSFRNRENDVIMLPYKDFNPLKKRKWFRHQIENLFFIPLDKKKSENWDKAKVVHHSSESWASEEVKYIIKKNLFLIIFCVTVIILLLVYLKRNRYLFFK